MRSLPAALPPDAGGLVVACAGRLDEGDFRGIAAADYGMEADEHLAQLHLIAREGRVPRPLQWVPREVLELTRLSEPDFASSADAIVRSHRRRAFACAVLLRAYGEPENHLCLNGQNETLIRLVASLRALGPGLDRCAAAFLAWLIPRQPEDEVVEHVFLRLALLWFALAPDADASDEALLALTDWIMAAEAAEAAEQRRRAGDETGWPWLLPLASCNAEHPLWLEFGGWLPRRLRPAHGPAVAENVRLIGAALSAAP